MSMIGPVQPRCHEGSPVGKRNLRWEGFVEKVGFEPGVIIFNAFVDLKPVERSENRSDM